MEKFVCAVHDPGILCTVSTAEVHPALLIQALKDVSRGCFGVLMCLGTLMGSGNGHVPY